MKTVKELMVKKLVESINVGGKSKKFLGKFRGTTATGQKANVVDTNPMLNQKPLRQFRIM